MSDDGRAAVRSALQAATPIQSAATDAESGRGRVRLLMAGDLEVRPPEWLIRDLLERQVLALVYGDPGTGKSFAALGLAASVATGEPWLGREVATTGPVIYVAGEGHSGIARRLRAWAQHHERTLTDVPLAVTAGPVGLGDPNQAAELEAAVDAAVPDLGASPVLVMIDTVARNFGPGDENSTQDMNRFIAAADAIAHRYGATVLLVHHTGHGDKTRHRGAMALKGALDAEYRLRLEVGGHVELLAQKMKDSPLPDPIGMRLRVVELDGVQSDDGAPVTSVVLEEADPPPSDDPALGRHQRTALDTLRELVADRERTLREGGYGPDGARVTVAQWRDACAAAGMDRRRISDARRTLAVHGHIVIDGVHVYPADEEATE